MTIVRRPVRVAVIVALSLLAALALLERGNGIDGDLAASRRFFTRPAPAVDVNASASLASSAASLQATLELQPANGVAQSHIPPIATNLACPILAQAGAQVTVTFNVLIASHPNLAAFLVQARASALAAINAQLAFFHCNISFG